MVLKSVGVVSVVKVFAALYAVLGLIGGLFLTVISLAGLAGGLAGEEGAALGLVFGVGAIVVLPVFYAAIGALVGAAGAALYNLFAGMLGGVRLDLEPDRGNG
jgi:hypothetical protein